MTEIIDGKVVHNELTKNAMGGTELVAYRLSNSIPQEMLQGVQIISSRVRELIPGKKVILHCHDLESDPESDIIGDLAFRSRVQKIVFVSNWQANQFVNRFGLSYDDFVVIENPIERFEPVPKQEDDIVRLIYHTTPHRGLALLVPVFEFLAQNDKKVHLDVYSSFNAYGWSDRDKPFEELFERCRSHPQISYHGYKPNDEIRTALGKANIFAYPNIWPETSCLALIEAVSAGCFAIHPNLAALPETAKGVTLMYQHSPDPQTIMNRLYNQLIQLIDFIRKINYQRPHDSAHIMNSVHDINAVTLKWTNLLRELS